MNVSIFIELSPGNARPHSRQMAASHSRACSRREMARRAQTNSPAGPFQRVYCGEFWV